MPELTLFGRQLDNQSLYFILFPLELNIINRL
jgi:hypothetical protein